MKKRIKFIYIFLVIITVINLYSENTRPTVGLVLSGGGARGFAHIGILKVLDSIGLEVDFIAGTSMGSIVGGLYAIGFTADEIQNVTNSIPWDSIFYDDVSRYDLPVEEKQYSEKYIFEIQMPSISFFPPGLNFSLPSGLVYGQKIQAILNEATWKVMGYKNFYEFPIPFICIASDVITAEAVVIDSGDLSSAIRASMCIPTIFTPIRQGNKILIDGGCIRNFPVQELIDLGPDIIIGVDISTSVLEAEELTSFLDIFNQMQGFRNMSTHSEQRSLCSSEYILITPELLTKDSTELKSTEFDEYERFIKLGEIAAMEYLDTLVKLKTFLDTYEKLEEVQHFNPDSLYFSNLEIKGLFNETRTFVEGAFPYNIPGWLDKKQIRDGIAKIFSTTCFEKVTYSIDKESDINTLIIEVEEKKLNFLNISAGYNSYNKLKWILNGTFRNYIFKGSKLILDLKYEKHFSSKFDYYINSLYSHQAWGLNLNFSGGYIQNYLHLYENGKEFSRFKYTTKYLLSRIILKIGNFCQFNIGVIGRNINKKAEIGPSYFVDADSTYASYFVNIAIDNLQSLYFPKQGLKLLFEISQTTCLYTSSDDIFTQSVFDMTFYIPIHRKVTYFGGVYAGLTNGNNIPAYFNYYAGGYKISQSGNVLYGYSRDEIFGQQLVTFQTGLQIEPWENRYIKFQYNAVKLAEDINLLELNDFNNYISGYGLTIGFKIPSFGPVDIGYIDYTITATNYEIYKNHYFSVGYIF